MSRFKRAMSIYRKGRKAYKKMPKRRKKQTSIGMMAAIAAGAYFLFFRKKD